MRLATSSAALGVLLTVACGDDTGGGNEAGNGGTATSGAATSAGATATAGSSNAGANAAGSNSAGGSSSNGDVSSLCMTVCAKYNQACAINADCAFNCQRIVDGPSACAGVQRNFLTCLSSRTPNCGDNDWAKGYEAECDSEGRAMCLLTGGAECIVGQAYDDTLCQAFAEGNFGYYCQANVVPKPGCMFSEGSTREGLYCCESKLSL